MFGHDVAEPFSVGGMGKPDAVLLPRRSSSSIKPTLASRKLTGFAVHNNGRGPKGELPFTR